jgi:hypothetical protein
VGCPWDYKLDAPSSGQRALELFSLTGLNFKLVLESIFSDNLPKVPFFINYKKYFKCEQKEYKMQLFELSTPTPKNNLPNSSIEEDLVEEQLTAANESNR